MTRRNCDPSSSNPRRWICCWASLGSQEIGVGRDYLLRVPNTLLQGPTRPYKAPTVEKIIAEQNRRNRKQQKETV